MLIRYKTYRLIFQIFIGNSLLLLGIVGIYENFNTFLIYGCILAGLYFQINFIFESTSLYLTIENGLLIKNSILSPKMIALHEIIEVKKSRGRYILKTAKEKLYIRTTLINQESMEELDSYLGMINTKFYKKKTPSEEKPIGWLDILTSIVI
ncbi:hypothetical protein OOZ15_13940 [Galbibacter sp. EGI 63066]|uniref:hypothetical protein n=1 Tax=Galbibacter sp. EGI 63066 TaxID=2993559 RepID=UPI0022497A3D|nr:hypothetical protein [Galbibacter sp. EGI 63066]MCX2681049.1 hypothetical protein [Galbibacter sp. EGI 63066]